MIEIVFALGLIYFVLMCFMFYYSSAHFVLKSVCLVFFITTGLFTYNHYNKSLGAPIVGYPEYQFVYIHHIIEGDKIFLWTKKQSGLHDRLYVMPYDRETAKKLTMAQQGAGNGTMMSGQFTSNEILSPGLELDRWDGPTGKFQK